MFHVYIMFLCTKVENNGNESKPAYLVSLPVQTVALHDMVDLENNHYSPGYIVRRILLRNLHHLQEAVQ